jgi:hypothetical protein
MRGHEAVLASHEGLRGILQRVKMGVPVSLY